MKFLNGPNNYFRQVANLTSRVITGIFLITILIMASPAEISHAIDLTLTGSYSETIDSTDLSSGPGSDLTPVYESDADAISIDISNSGGAADSWRVDVNKSDISWPATITLYVQRTSDGFGGTISGGGSYIEVTNTVTQLFSGTDDITGIELQYKLEDISVSIDASTYNTNIVYTVIDI